VGAPKGIWDSSRLAGTGWTSGGVLQPWGGHAERGKISTLGD